MSAASQSATNRGSQPKEALLGFLPCVSAWFNRSFDVPSPAQVLAWPAIRRGENTCRAIEQELARASWSQKQTEAEKEVSR